MPQPSGLRSADLARVARELPPQERLDLARRLVESVVAPASLNETISEGMTVQNIIDVRPFVFRQPQRPAPDCHEFE